MIFRVRVSVPTSEDLKLNKREIAKIQANRGFKKARQYVSASARATTLCLLGLCNHPKSLSSGMEV